MAESPLRYPLLALDGLWQRCVGVVLEQAWLEGRATSGGVVRLDLAPRAAGLTLQVSTAQR